MPSKQYNQKIAQLLAKLHKSSSRTMAPNAEYVPDLCYEIAQCFGRDIEARYEAIVYEVPLKHALAVHNTYYVWNAGVPKHNHCAWGIRVGE